MKRIAITLALSLAACTSLFAAHVDPQRAHAVAQRFWNSLPAPKAAQPLVDRSEMLGLPHLYLFAPQAGNGYVIVAADDRVLPIMAYSTTAPVAPTLPYGAGHWLAGLDRHIARLCQLVPTQSAPVAAQWDTAYYRPHPAPKATISRPVEPLLPSTWNQAPYYNFMCPFDSAANERSVSGCTVTAMTQIMKYWNHPYNGTGSHSYYHRHFDSVLSADFGEATYNWDIMPNSLNSHSSWAAINAVSLITYHAGVAVEMDYSGHASGAYVHAYGNDSSACAENALWRYFKYDHASMHSMRRDSVPWSGGTSALNEHYTLINDNDWQALIDNELLAGRPVLYTGYDSNYSGGHAFVCDGADGQGKYHFNWGWGGYLDGYYLLGNLVPGWTDSLIGANTSGSYNIGQAITIGIKPLPEHIDTLNITGKVCPAAPIEVLGHTYTTDAHDTLRHLTTVAFINLEADVVRTCGLRDGMGDATMPTISSCPSVGFVLPQCDFSHPGYHFIGWNAAIDGSGPMYQPGDTISARGNRNVYAQWATGNGITIASPDLSLTLGPNPASHHVSLRCNGTAGGNCQIRIYNQLGQCLRTLNIAANGQQLDTQITLADLPAGAYTISLTTQNGHAIGRIIKQ